MTTSNKFYIAPISRELVGKTKSGKWGVYESTFKLEHISEAGEPQVIVEITQQSLLPATKTEEYITLAQASELYDILVDELVELCEKGIVEGFMVDEEWMVLLESIERYISDEENK